MQNYLDLDIGPVPTELHLVKTNAKSCRQLLKTIQIKKTDIQIQYRMEEIFLERFQL